MIHETMWSPDTCSCILIYTWDDALDENVRTHTIERVLRRCPAHASLTKDTEIYGTVVEENTRKNKAFGLAQGIVPNLTTEDYEWSFDANRKLRATFRGKLSVTQAVKLRQTCDSQLGANRVEVS